MGISEGIVPRDLLNLLLFRAAESFGVELLRSIGKAETRNARISLSRHDRELLDWCMDC